MPMVVVCFSGVDTHSGAPEAQEIAGITGVPEGLSGMTTSEEGFPVMCSVTERVGFHRYRRCPATVNGITSPGPDAVKMKVHLHGRNKTVAMAPTTPNTTCLSFTFEK